MQICLLHFHSFLLFFVCNKRISRHHSLHFFILQEKLSLYLLQIHIRMCMYIRRERVQYISLFTSMTLLLIQLLSASVCDSVRVYVYASCGGSEQSLDEHIIAEICICGRPIWKRGYKVASEQSSAMTMVLHVQHKLCRYVYIRTLYMNVL